jgi:NAD(P)H-flavin reductase
MPVELQQVPVGDPPMVPSRHRVVAVTRELADTVTFELEPIDRALDPPEPGQFNMVYAFGQGEVPISVSGDPARGDTVVHTIRSVGATTQALCALGPGDVVGLRGPYGRGWDVERARGRDVVVIGGGIGFAPLRPIVYRILEDRQAYGRVNVLVGARSPETLLYRAELEEWRARSDLSVEVTVDRAGPDWRGDVGVVTGLIARAGIDPAGTVAFLCGPEIMMRFAANTLTGRGVSPGDIEVSLERNMKCAIAQCGHCQLGPIFVCREGPVGTWERLQPLLAVRGL